MITEEILAVSLFKPLDKRKKQKSDYVFFKGLRGTDYEVHHVNSFSEIEFRNWIKTDSMYYAYVK